MFGFAKYLYRIYKQIKKIHQIKSQIEFIFNTFTTDDSNINHIEKYEELKQNIFSCGSLYIKFFQWYISKLKSNIVEKNKFIDEIIDKTNGNTDSNTDSNTNSNTDSNTDSKTDSNTDSNIEINNKNSEII